MKEYFFVKVQIGIIAERGVFLKLIDEIESLIDMHQEGGYWDFTKKYSFIRLMRTYISIESFHSSISFIASCSCTSNISFLP